MWIYFKTEPTLFTVGFFSPANSQFVSCEDYSTAKEAGNRCNYLNGGALVNNQILAEAQLLGPTNNYLRQIADELARVATILNVVCGLVNEDAGDRKLQIEHNDRIASALEGLENMR